MRSSRELSRFGARRATATLSGALLAVGLGLSACSSAKALPDPTPGPPTRSVQRATLPPAPPPRSQEEVVVTGTVVDGLGDPVSSAVITFAPVGGREVDATVDADGTYSVSLSPGDYTVMCTALAGPCSASGHEGEPTTDIQVTVAGTMDFVVDDSAQDQSTDGNDGDDTDLAGECRSEGFTVCGTVTQGGQPVPDLIIEAKFGNQNQTTTTNEQGVYALRLQLPVATLLCEESESMLDNNLLCEPVGGSGGPVSIDSEQTGQIVNFSIVPS